MGRCGHFPGKTEICTCINVPCRDQGPSQIILSSLSIQWGICGLVFGMDLSTPNLRRNPWLAVLTGIMKSCSFPDPPSCGGSVECGFLQQFFPFHSCWKSIKWRSGQYGSRCDSMKIFLSQTNGGGAGFGFIFCPQWLTSDPEDQKESPSSGHYNCWPERVWQLLYCQFDCQNKYMYCIYCKSNNFHELHSGSFDTQLSMVSIHFAVHFTKPTKFWLSTTCHILVN